MNSFCEHLLSDDRLPSPLDVSSKVGASTLGFALPNKRCIYTKARFKYALNRQCKQKLPNEIDSWTAEFKRGVKIAHIWTRCSIREKCVYTLQYYYIHIKLVHCFNVNAYQHCTLLQRWYIFNHCTLLRWQEAIQYKVGYLPLLWIRRNECT